MGPIGGNGPDAYQHDPPQAARDYSHEPAEETVPVLRSSKCRAISAESEVLIAAFSAASLHIVAELEVLAALALRVRQEAITADIIAIAMVGDQKHAAVAAPRPACKLVQPNLHQRAPDTCRLV